MPKAIVKLSKFDLDKNQYAKTLHEDIMQQMRMAARAFMYTAMRAIPVRTGFARGSFKNIAEATGLGGGNSRTTADTFLRATQVLRTHELTTKAGRKSSSSRRGTKGNGAKVSLEYYRDGKRKVLKTPDTGREFATQSSQIFQSDGFVYTFNFESLISYLNINDMFVNPRNPGTPWGGFELGRATFLNYLKTQALLKLSSVQAFITESSVSVSGTTVTQTAFVSVNRGV